MFGRKKKEEAQPEPEAAKTETMEAKDDKVKEEHLTAEDKQTLSLIEAYKKKYDGVYNANDFLTVNDAFVEAEKLNLNFAVYSEIVELRKELKELTKAVNDSQ